MVMSSSVGRPVSLSGGIVTMIQICSLEFRKGCGDPGVYSVKKEREKADDLQFQKWMSCISTRSSSRSVTMASLETLKLEVTGDLVDFVDIQIDPIIIDIVAARLICSSARTWLQYQAPRLNQHL